MAGVQTPQIQLTKAKSQDGPITTRMILIRMIPIQRASLGAAAVVVTITHPVEIGAIDLNEVVQIPENASIVTKQATSLVFALIKPARTVNSLVPKVASIVVKKVTCHVIAPRKENSNNLDPEMVRGTDLPGVALNVERKAICQGNVPMLIIMIGVLQDVITGIVMTLKMETIVEEVVRSLIGMVAEAIIGMTEDGMESRGKKGQGMKEGTDRGIGMITMGTDQRVVLSVAKMVILQGSAHKVEVIQEMAHEEIEMKEETAVAGQMTQALAPAGEQVMYET